MKNKIVIIIMIIIIIKVLRVPTPYMAQGRLDSISPLGPIVCAGDMHGHAHAGTAVPPAGGPTNANILYIAISHNLGHVL
jgi:hypothetical protein